MAEWQEIQQLAADFRRIQEAESAHKLSERNCIEVVNRLIDMGLVEVVYTLDGKEYVTPQQLEREIKTELVAHRGRVNVIELQEIINVDLSHVESKVSEMIRRDRSLLQLQGDLISKDYTDGLCEEINDSLQESGRMNVADISKSFSLPNSFVLEVLENSLGAKINGELDKSGSGIIYTEAYVSRYRSRIRGLFSAITCPTSVGPLIVQGGFQEKLFLSVLHKLISSGQLRGSLHGHGDKAVYVPQLYIHMQNKWSDSFLSSNGYLEYDALRRLGIDDPKGYVSRRYCDSPTESKVLLLPSCAVGEDVLRELEGAVEDIHNSDVEWMDVLPLLPTPCSTEDAQQILQKKYSSDDSLHLFKNYIATRKLVQSCHDLFLPLIKDAAAQAATKHSALLSEMVHEESEVSEKPSRSRSGKEKKSARKERGSHKQGGGHKLQFMSTDKVAEEILKTAVQERDLAQHIAELIQRDLQSVFLKEAVAALSIDSLQTGQPSANELRKRHAHIQDKIQGLWNMVHLFNKSIDKFEGEAAVQLSKYLLKTLCSDLVNIIVLYLAEDLGLVAGGMTELSVKDRGDTISKFPDHIRRSLSAVNSSLNGKDVNAFFELYQNLCTEDYSGFMLKNLDKKKERQLVFSHQQSLLQNLKEEADCAMALHLVLVVLFYQETKNIIHIPGKFIPNMISFLHDHLSLSVYDKLIECQHLISVQWKSRQSANSGEVEASSQEEVTSESSIQKLIQDLKQIVVTPKSS